MKKSSIIWLVVVIVIIVILGIWYWSAGQSNSGNANVVAPLSAASSPAVAAPTPVTVLTTASTTNLGTFLVAMNGMTLYKYTNDTPGVSTCRGGCATIWPPYTIPASEASSSFIGDASVNGQVGIITRTDGSYQVTYNGSPLYFYAKDKKVGDATGQNVGGVWFVVSP